ncbi:sensor histidine kinase [filamentous cyanobacterium LEGE 11480]|uniref:Oxygen sensor histidine kinase NreB n=1 Tax=Romeriopsis navalis LEGE 11480 TaxID=2777977 RepID=A0A928VP88_9CYAN|nr:sensor histidine kinase [Romeriopsis navalis]MBE9031242.1 sensor histidine kinase [Romeriopsis navalis LEGE 11480]
MITPKNHPIKFLLQFEWVLLIIAFLLELPQWQFGPERSSFWLSGLLIISFALLGLYLPNHEPKLKGAHLVASFTILLLATFAAKIRFIPLLCVVLIVRTSLMFQNPARIFITIAAFLLALCAQVDRFQTFQTRHAQRIERRIERRIARRIDPNLRNPPPPRRERDRRREDRMIIGAISSTMLLGLVLVFLQLMVDAVLSERQSREQLQQANDQLRRYALRVEDVATLQERNRIAREIHDSLGHSLTAFNLHVEAALRLFTIDPDEAKDLLVEAKQLGSTALQEVRQSVSTLRTKPLQGKSLQAAIVHLLEDFTRSTGIQPTTQFHGLAQIKDDEAMALYRIIQEALTNIAKYAQATAVSIRLEHAAPQTILKIKDDGRGFDQQQNRSGFGLQGMQERTNAIGGRYNLRSAVGQGTQITIQIP